MDIHDKTNNQVTLFRHESFQLWESEVRGFVIRGKKDFCILSKSGLNILALGAIDKRMVMDENQNERMIHSLESVNYLKVAPENYILFECAQANKVISIQSEFSKTDATSGEETNYENVYSIQLHDITLRELLLFQSIYVCKTQSDIVALVEDQPSPSVFYKSFLELDGSNMVSMLSFDSRSMAHLLNDRNSEYFSDAFPIFYRNKISKNGSHDGDNYYYISAIDRALRSNQVKAVEYMVDYIVEYQNNYVSSYLFTKNLPVFLEKGIHCHSLLDSQVFSRQFDFDEWPSSHTNDETHLRPYTGSIFKVRHAYKEVFHEDEFKTIQEQNQEAEIAGGDAIENNKIFKIRYSINLLPGIGETITKD